MLFLLLSLLSKQQSNSYFLITYKGYCNNLKAYLHKGQLQHKSLYKKNIYSVDTLKYVYFDFKSKEMVKQCIEYTESC